ncbi:putative terminase large subunit [uncultured Caudovirales phage]|uniref:Putative terminase large subunit n=1 Tax=uncultured Caudovirales phage TaxID=2100421 RepID=A0A2H4J557_9CAUD|nr:putative terminase large subunit [uncultured Caudovirales phage]
MQFDPWQRGFGSISLGLDESGLYASTIGGVVASIPRQVGKTYTIGNLLIGLCLVFPGMRVIWTSHHLQTTSNTFQSMQGMVRRKKIFAHIAEIRLVNGEQRIRFRNGSVIMFGARAMGFGRGMDKIDIEVFDEAQILPLRALEDMVPATNQAQHEHGALLFFIGTPPRPVDDGEAFTSKRLQALEGNSDDDMVYVEFSADPEASPDDRSQWPVMNPSYPSRTPLASMLRMRKNLPDEAAWRREAMGIWDDTARHKAVIKKADWDLLADDGPADGVHPDALGMHVSHSGLISVSACWADGEDAHAEEVWAGSDSESAVRWVRDRVRRRTPVMVYGQGPSAALIPELRARRVRVNQASVGDMAKGCGLLLNRVAAGSFTHAGQGPVGEALAVAPRRATGTAGGWAWDLADESVNIAPIVALTLALFEATVTKKVASGGRGNRSSQGREAVVL